MAECSDMRFVPMTSITKKADTRAHKCSDWVATEKVHGSSFQFYTNDGVNLNVGSRRRNLDMDGSFLKCSIKNLKNYQICALKLWHNVNSDDRWATYREYCEGYDESDDDDDDDADDNGNGEDGNNDADDTNCDDGAIDEPADNSGDTRGSADESPVNKAVADGDTREECRVRVYGELYGGGGLENPEKVAVQKEILYCDDFRFYVFGVTINRKWVTIAELNDLCRDAGFPYYAKPMCEPMETVDALKQWLEDRGCMKTRSALTDRTDNYKSHIEGVVMTPLKRPDFRLHAVKFLAPAFNDVREAQFGQTKTANFCTKQRYHSVISKLDLPERNNTNLVVDMFIQDIIKESPDKRPNDKLKGIWTKLVVQWLAEDEYNVDEGAIKENKPHKASRGEKKKKKERIISAEEERKKAQRKNQREEVEEDVEPIGLDMFDL